MTPLRRIATAAAVLAVTAFAVLGLVQAAGSTGPPSVNEQVNAVSATLRCPTCQGLSIKDSPSVLAAGSRQIVEEQVRQGRSQEQIRQYFVDRYGPYVLLSPDPAGPGLLAWLIPAVALPGAGILGWRRLRGRRTPAPAVAAEPGTDPEADEDARQALAAHRAGLLEPDSSPAGEALREALAVRLAAAEDDVPGLQARADERLGAAYRRYRTRAVTGRRTGRGGGLPRGAVTALVAALLVVGAGGSLAVGLRERGATDLPTGDLPGAVPGAPEAEGLGDLIAATRERPDDPLTWRALGRAYQAGGELTEAVVAYDSALALDPSADDVVLLRAEVLVEGGSAREALPALQRLGARYPDDPGTLLLLGLAQDAIGGPEADDTLRRYLELAPVGPGADQARRLLAER